MNFGTHCETPGCEYRSEMDSELCLHCNLVLEQRAGRYEAEAWRFFMGRLYPDEREAA